MENYEVYLIDTTLHDIIVDDGKHYLVCKHLDGHMNKIPMTSFLGYHDAKDVVDAVMAAKVYLKVP